MGHEQKSAKTFDSYLQAGWVLLMADEAFPKRKKMLQSYKNSFSCFLTVKITFSMNLHVYLHCFNCQ